MEKSPPVSPSRAQGHIVPLDNRWFLHIYIRGIS
jgi:hypothetical protein